MNESPFVRNTCKVQNKKKEFRHKSNIECDVKVTFSITILIIILMNAGLCIIYITQIDKKRRNIEKQCKHTAKKNVGLCFSEIPKLFFPNFPLKLL